MLCFAGSVWFPQLGSASIATQVQLGRPPSAVGPSRITSQVLRLRDSSWRHARGNPGALRPSQRWDFQLVRKVGRTWPETAQLRDLWSDIACDASVQICRQYGIVKEHQPPSIEVHEAPQQQAPTTPSNASAPVTPPIANMPVSTPESVRRRHRVL